MTLFKMLLLDTQLSYWHVLAACTALAQFRFWNGIKWIFVAFVALILFAICSESWASPEDKDGVYTVGSVLRIVNATAVLAVGTYCGTLIRRMLPAVTRKE